MLDFNFYMKKTILRRGVFLRVMLSVAIVATKAVPAKMPAVDPSNLPIDKKDAQ